MVLRGNVCVASYLILNGPSNLKRQTTSIRRTGRMITSTRGQCLNPFFSMPTEYRASKSRSIQTNRFTYQPDPSPQMTIKVDDKQRAMSVSEDKRVGGIDIRVAASENQ